MESNLNNAVVLFGVGMLAVFFILLLVVILGNILIRVINKYFPEKNVRNEKPNVGIDESIRSALNEVVRKVTHGKGQIRNIEKIK